MIELYPTKENSNYDVITTEVASQPLNDLLYGVVEWIDGNPVLDGMPYFDDKDTALKYATEQAGMGGMILPMKVEYTIIRLKKAI